MDNLENGTTKLKTQVQLKSINFTGLKMLAGRGGGTLRC